MRQFFSLVLVATAAAQMDMKALIGDLSSQCQAATGGLMTSDFSSCSNLMGLVNILGANGSLLAPMNTWVDSICNMSPCSASVISTAKTTVQGGCEADVKKGVPSALEIALLVSNYAVVRNALCLEYKSNHTRCASDLLATTEKVSGRPLTLAEVSGFIVGSVSSLAPALAKAPKDNFCNDCTHALNTALSPIHATAMSSSMPSMAMNSSMPSMLMNSSMSSMLMNSSMSSMPMNSSMSSMPMNSTSKDSQNMTSGWVAMCGPSFSDGKIPDSIAVNDGTSSSGNAGKSPANGGAPSSATSVTIPVFVSLAIFGTTAVFTTLF